MLSVELLLAAQYKLGGGAGWGAALLPTFYCALASTCQLLQCRSEFWVCEVGGLGGGVLFGAPFRTLT